MRIQRYFILIAALAANTAMADLTGAGDAAILSKLIEQMAVMREQLEQAKDSVNIGKRMEQMEKLKSAKKLHAEGKAFKDMLDEYESIVSEIEGFRADPVGVDKPRSEMQWLNDALKGADTSSNSAKAYASILMELKNLEFLGKANAASQEKLARGTNTEEESQITASNTLIMSKILLEREARAQEAAANNASIVSDVLGNPGYSALSTESN